MTVKQLSVFLENVSGRLRSVTSILTKHQINIRALSLADAADFGVLRLIVDKPEEAQKILKENNFTVNLMDVIGVEMDDSPGGLDKILEIIAKDHINVEYMYTFIGSATGKATVIFKVDKPILAINILEDNGINLVKLKDISK